MVRAASWMAWDIAYMAGVYCLRAKEAMVIEWAGIRSAGEKDRIRTSGRWREVASSGTIAMPTPRGHHGLELLVVGGAVDHMGREARGLAAAREHF